MLPTKSNPGDDPDEGGNQTDERATATPSESAPPTAAPGWYATPEGGQRYWDGSVWLDIPVPPSTGAIVRAPRPLLARRTRWLIVASVTLVVLLAAGGLAWKASSDAAATKAAAEVAAELKAEQEADAKRIEDNKRATEKREAAEEQAELESRNASVDDIEAGVKKMAEGHASDGVIDGPIIDVTCSPVDGGSLDDIAEQTTVFSCFASNKDNGDGTMSGYSYNATMNWTTGQFTYGLGEP
ncbi:Sec-independent protein translocase protein TatA [Agromyces terreus]|uniref:Sec-independent protein translocase protein TatA n=1 Tax=Agromyces terreus TaxID=424795 RepID=A0A9X2H1J1_9MICO|nr:DUF2510 domain-containing protein [Agromyces terreus]MCP2370878.1 Sec-independent protein translocase protein TatA [Agromyces terreus]